MKGALRQAHLILVVAFGIGCTTAQPKAEVAPKADLDIVSTPPKGMPQPDWKQFFKSSPNPTERKLIQRKLDAWKDEGDVSSLLGKAKNLIAIGKIAEAEAVLRQALRRNDNNPETLLELAQLYVRKKDGDRAFTILANVKDSISATDRDQRLLLMRYRYTLAMAHLLRGDRDKANGILTDLIAIDGKFIPGYTALAGSYLAGGKYEIAEFIARRGIDRGMEDPSLYSSLGSALERQGRSEEAKQAFDRALQINAAHVPSLINKASLAIKGADCKEALELLARVNAYAPNEADAYIGQGVCQRRAKKLEQAKASFAKALELDPENPVSRYNLAVMMTEDLNQPAEGLRLFQEVVQSSQENPEVKKLAQAFLDRQGGQADQDE